MRGAPLLVLVLGLVLASPGFTQEEAEAPVEEAVPTLQDTAAVDTLAEAEPEPQLLLDFVNVQHLSSGALGVLITLNKQVVARQGRLVLANIHPQIYEHELEPLQTQSKRQNGY